MLSERDFKSAFSLQNKQREIFTVKNCRRIIVGSGKYFSFLLFRDIIMMAMVVWWLGMWEGRKFIFFRRKFLYFKMKNDFFLSLSTF